MSESSTQCPAKTTSKVTSSEELIDALVERKRKTFNLHVGSRIIELNIQSISWQEKFLYERESALQLQNKGNPAVAELMWVQFGVVDDEGKPLFKSKSEVEKLRSANPSQIEELIYAIKAISGYAPDVDWDDLYSTVCDLTVNRIMMEFRKFYEHLIHDDYRQAFEDSQSDIRSVIYNQVRASLEQASHIAVSKFKWGDDHGLTEEELGNSFEQTLSSMQSGRSASSNSEGSHASSSESQTAVQ